MSDFFPVDLAGGVKYLTTSITSDQVAAGNVANVVVPVPSDATKIHAIIPCGISANNTWTGVTGILIRGVILNERKIFFQSFGTSNQTYVITYTIIYE